MDITLNEIADIIDNEKGKGYFSTQFEKSLRPILKKFNDLGKEVNSNISLSDFIFLDEARKTKISDRYVKVVNQLLDNLEKAKIGDFLKIDGEVVSEKESNKKEDTKETPDNKEKYKAGVDKKSDDIITKLEKTIESSTPSITNAKELEKVKNNRNLSISDIPDIDKSITNAKKEEDFELEERKRKAMDVILIGITPKVLQGLYGIGDLSNKDITDSDKEKEKEKLSMRRKRSPLGRLTGMITSMLGGLAKFLLGGTAGLLVLTAGAMALWHGFKTDGASKGFMKMLGTKLTKIGLDMVDNMFSTVKKIFMPKFLTNFFSAKVIAPTTAKLGKITAGKGLFKGLLRLVGKAGKGTKFIFKRIPILGSLISFAFAYSRFQKGDILGGVLDIVSGLLTLDPTGIGSALAIIPDMINTFRDVTMSPAEKRQQSSFLQPVIDWFMNLRYIKALRNTFSGLALVLGGETSDDVDKGMALLTDDNSLVRIMFPFILPLIDLFYWLSDGGSEIIFEKTASGLTSFGEWIWKSVGKLWEGLTNILDIVWKRILKTLSNIADSVTVQKMVKNTRLNMLKFVDKLAFGKSKTIKDDIARTEEEINALNAREIDQKRKIEVEKKEEERRKKEEKERQLKEDEAIKLAKEQEKQRAKDQKTTWEQNAINTEAIVNATNGIKSAIAGNGITQQYTNIFGEDKTRASKLRLHLLESIYGNSVIF